MKKIPRVRLVKISHRAIKNWKKQIRRKKQIGRVNFTQKHIKLPSEFNFSNNYSETVRSLEELRSATVSKIRQTTSNVYMDLTQVKKISLAGALVLAAEIDRWRRIRQISLKPVKQDKWDQKVKDLLNSLGFFKLLGTQEDIITKNNNTHKDYVILELNSYNTLDQRAMVNVISEIMDSANEITEIDDFDIKRQLVYVAIYEAIHNAKSHAYPSKNRIPYRYTKRWWVNGVWLRKEKVLKFLVFDQGIGIPASLPFSNNWEAIRDYISNLATFVKNDSKLIEAAIQESRTSLDRGRGQGLMEVVEPVYELEGSSVRIFSGKGSYKIFSDKRVEIRDHDTHIGGTLIEWTIPL